MLLQDPVADCMAPVFAFKEDESCCPLCPEGAALCGGAMHPVVDVPSLVPEQECQNQQSQSCWSVRCKFI